jgi:hypothetical protein
VYEAETDACCITDPGALLTDAVQSLPTDVAADALETPATNIAAAKEMIREWRTSG